MFSKRTMTMMFFVFVTFTGCKTIKLADINVGNPIKNKLPALEIFSDQTAAALSYYGYTNIQSDTHSMFTKLMQENITNPFGEKYGYVSYNLVVVVNKIGGYGFYIPSILSLTTLNLLGMPYFTAKTSIEVTVQISDSNKELIGIYKGAGESKTFVAYYYGYGLTDALRAANLQSLRKVFSSITSQIEKESLELTKKLKETGPIKK